ncbi:MAG: NAD(P)-binding domain-containing protein [Actinomycetota bacterium]|nr:NAD(P)-binding domain-containing protein [Actinomycetota bacterium]
MAQLSETERPFPPGRYPAIIIGSGPGAIQTSYFLRRYGVEHAVISSDDKPGGMFQLYPLFQRLISWTKPHAPAPRGTRAYQKFDWNSLIADEPEASSILPPLMDGSSYFPSRPEMELGIRTFVEKANIKIRFGCRWESTKKVDDGFVVGTNDGEYHAQVMIVAVGTTTPWKPSIKGIEQVPHYVETKSIERYAGRSVFILGKRNSGFEVADGLLPVARQIILASPRPARISVMVHSTAAARARYLQPYEDHVLGGGNIVLDAATDSIERNGDGYRVHAMGTTNPGDHTFDVDEVIAATGFSTPMVDLPALGVKTFFQGRLPAQTPYFESSTIDGIYFAGSITQGSIGLKKYGIPSNSAAVHGFRYNAGVLARHLAETRFGVKLERPVIEPASLVGYLVDEVTRAPELWNQPSYLARVVYFDETSGLTDQGILPLADFVDSSGPDGIAVAVETDDNGNIHPAAYLRRHGDVAEHLLPSNDLLDFATSEHHAQLKAMLSEWVG